MRAARQLVATIAFAIAAAIFCAGCPAMMVPGLAYSGYKYVHDKNTTQTASNTRSGRSTNTTSASSTRTKKSTDAASSKSAAAQRQKIPDSEIE
jgi:hypothetical protein